MFGMHFGLLQQGKRAGHVAVTHSVVYLIVRDCSVYLYDQAPGPRHASAAAASMHSHNPYMGGVQRVWGVQPQ